MKLRNKRTSEIGYLSSTNWNETALIIMNKDGVQLGKYNSIAELNVEWEDAPEEPKEWWYIDIHGPHNVIKNDEYYQVVKEASKEVGNYFETKEEAEKAVEKLKALKRLKDNGFMIAGWDYEGFGMKVEAGRISFEINKDCNEDKDLDLLFGGEE